MTTGDVTAELLDLFGGLIGGADVDFVSRPSLYCEVLKRRALKINIKLTLMVKILKI